MRVTLVLVVVLLSVTLAQKPKKKGPRGIVQNIRPRTATSFVAGIDQNASVNVTIQLQKPFKGAPVEGHGLWDVSLWLGKLKSGKSSRLGMREGQVLTMEQSGQVLSTRDTALYFQNISIIADLRGLGCSKINYLCASFDSRSPVLKVKANNIGCSSINCIECGSDFCTLEYTPVCGSDGTTYSNECHFNNAVCDNPGLVLANEGECEPECGSDICTLDYTPVCGSDGTTYSNECHFNNAVCDNSELVLVYEGECEPECGSDFCTLDYTPVCGSDGTTYSNECHFNNAVCDNSNLVLANEGQCEPECGSDFCTLDYTPVCGSDGTTYSNECHFNNAVCDNSELVLVNEGECEPECGSDLCTLEYQPICGSDGQTYGNLCKFTNAVCDNPDLTEVHVEECEPECGSDSCTLDYQPVCGSEGQTYSNLCQFTNAVCGNPDLTEAYPGACKSKCGSEYCTAHYRPVCGSDGQTYNNLCQFNNAVCELPDLIVVNEGECVVDWCADVVCEPPRCPEDVQYTPDCCPECPADWGVDPCVFRGNCEPSIIDICAGVTCEELLCPEDLQYTYEGRCCPECPQDWGVDPCELGGTCGGIPSPEPTLDCSRRKCFRDYEPVCGSDGNTYNNPCLFRYAAYCDSDNLTRVSEGLCPIDVVRLEQGRLDIVLPKGRKPVIRLDVKGIISADSPTVTGDNLWRLELFSARSEDGNSADSYEYRDQVLDARSTARTARTGRKFAVMNVRVDYPLWDAACNGFGYLCAHFRAIEGADPALGDVNLLNCEPVKCKRDNL